jgi:hypothetical protein
MEIYIMIVFLNRVKRMLKPVLKALSLVWLVGVSTLEAAQYARKTAAALGTAAYWGLTVASPVGMAYSLKVRSDEEKAYTEHHENVDAEVLSKTLPFLKKELELLGLPKARVIPHGSTIAYIKDICIERDLLEKAEESFARIEQAKINQEEPLDEDLKAIKELQGTLHHEANHLLHGDTTWRLFALATGSALVPVGLRAAYRAARPAVDQVKKMSNMRKVLSGWVNMAVSGQIFNVGSRAIEQQADDGINNREAMEGLLAYLQKEHDRLRIATRITDCPKIFPDEAQQEVYENFLQKLNDGGLWCHDHISSHPSPASRIEKLKSRLDEKE